MTESASRQGIGDDMHDSPEDLASLSNWPALHDALVTLGELLVPSFDTADARALQRQRRYRWVILLTASGGSAAVLFALAQLTLERLSRTGAAHWAARGEVVALGTTVVAVALGSLVVWLESWLIDRFRAEQLRLLKFRALLDPRIWGSTEQRTVWRADVQEQREHLAMLSRKELKHQSERESIPRLVTRDDCRDMAPDSFDALVRYYRQKRVITQRDYFAAAASRGIAFFDRPKLLPFFFGMSVLIVATHVAIDRWPGVPAAYAERRDIASTLLIAASAALPVTWAGIRTWRSAREFSRNVARSTARREMLDEMARRLDGSRQVDPSHLLGELQICELILESDQREWLRLMREVEWYG